LTVTAGAAPPVAGCTDPGAPNYNADAEVDDGSCEAWCDADELYSCGYYLATGNYDCETLVGYGYDCSMCEDECPVVGCTDDTADNYNPDATMDDGSCAYTCASMTVTMCDSYGDGWNGNVLTIGDATYAATSGSPCEDACYDGPVDVVVTCDGGSWQSEVSWSISDDSGELLAGGAPYSGCLGDCSTAVFGCTDPSAPEYNEEATDDDGSCWAACTGNLGWLGDGYCDGSNNNDACGFDGGDCCPGDCVDGTYSCESYGGNCGTCVDPNSADLAEGGQCYEAVLTCVDTECGLYIDSYTCEQLEGFELDCTECIDEGLCAEDQGVEGCLFDFTAYGAPSCDLAYDYYGLDCASLEAN